MSNIKTRNRKPEGIGRIMRDLLSPSALVFWAAKQSTGNATRNQLLVVLADNYNKRRGYCWLGFGELAERAECSRSTVKRHLKVLEIDGWIYVSRKRKQDGTNFSNRYTFCHIEDRVKNGSSSRPTVNPPLDAQRTPGRFREALGGGPIVDPDKPKTLNLSKKGKARYTTLEQDLADRGWATS